MYGSLIYVDDLVCHLLKFMLTMIGASGEFPRSCSTIGKVEMTKRRRGHCSGQYLMLDMGVVRGISKCYLLG